MKQFNIGILGATGAVGQKFIHLLQGHPWFQITALGASERSAGRPYGQAVNWIEPAELPEEVAEMRVTTCSPDQMPNVDFVFSGLDSSVATEIERQFAEAGVPVISNAKNYRTHQNVPLLVPEVNPDHVNMIPRQTFDSNGKGFIVTNPNCVVVPLVMVLKPLMETYGIEAVSLTSLQSVSGAGYPGVASLDILGNVVPFISGEEPKIAAEPMKLLGKLNDDHVVTEANFHIDATATRVPTIEGHLIAAKIKFSKKPESALEVKEVLRTWKNPIASLELPSAPKTAVKVYDDERFPQPRKNAYNENGMQVGVGRVRDLEYFDTGMVILGHNTCRGAAGVAILNAELLAKYGYIS